MKLNILVCIVVVVITGLVTLWMDHSAQPPARETKPPAPAVKTDLQTAPEFSFTTIDGKTKSLADFKDKVIVLNFWASWCAPCVEEFPQMIRLARRNEDKMVILFLSLDAEDAALRRFLDKMDKIEPGFEKSPAIVIGLDRTMAISQKLFQTYRLPESFIIAKDKSIARKIVGASVVWDGPDMQDTIDKLYMRQ